MVSTRPSDVSRPTSPTRRSCSSTSLIRPSSLPAPGSNFGRRRLLIFGNPPLGIQFLTSKPAAGLDWPVRLLVTEDAQGQVWAMYTDFAWIARRHGIENRDVAFKMASDVIASIASSVVAK